MSGVDYAKHNHDELFRDLENPNFTHLTDIQNYIPIYSGFFDLTSKNSRHLNFQTKYVPIHINEKLSHNKYDIIIQNCNTWEKSNKNVYCKFSPLIDPIKYTLGKYKDISEETFYTLPSVDDDTTNTNVLEKYRTIHNSAYVDALFSYCSSKLLDDGFIHANDYYGMFLANQNKFRANIEDDLEYMVESQFFHNNKNKLFEVENADEMFMQRSFKYKKPLVLKENITSAGLVDDFPLDIIDTIFEPIKYDNTSQMMNVTHDLSAAMVENMVYETELVVHNINAESCKDDDDSVSTCSSSSSITEEGNRSDINQQTEDSCSDEEGEDEEEDGSCVSDDEAVVVINKFPVLAIFTECCENTLDNYMMNNDISNNEWTSIMFQIVAILLNYQRKFQFTHNDLHSCNIVYENTSEQNLYYNIDNVNYKVPTHGHVFKIIDFGRSIFTLKGIRFCSDSFSKGEDADTQYNTEPYFNEDKPRIEPNYSFDLCRFGCSMYDFFIDDPADEEEECKQNPIARLVRDWCLDDNDKNILYKKSGEERYPEFKLYKMIARSVHNHTPEKQLARSLFKRFVVNTKMKSNKIMKI